MATTKRERREVTAKEVKVLVHNRYGYHGSGVFPITDNWFYRVVGEDGVIYIVSTSKEIWVGDKFVASVIGENEFRGEKQTKLSRVSILEVGPNRPKYKGTPYLGGLISTDGDFCGY